MKKEMNLIGLTSILIIFTLDSSILFIYTLANENDRSTISFNKIIYDEITTKVNMTLFESISPSATLNNVSAVTLSGSFTLIEDNLFYKIIKLTRDGEVLEIIINPLTGNILESNKSNKSIFPYFSSSDSFFIEKSEDINPFDFGFSNSINHNFTNIDGFNQIIPFQSGLHIADTAGLHDHQCIGYCKVLPNGDHEHKVKTTTE